MISNLAISSDPALTQCAVVQQHNLAERRAQRIDVLAAVVSRVIPPKYVPTCSARGVCFCLNRVSKTGFEVASSLEHDGKTMVRRGKARPARSAAKHGQRSTFSFRQRTKSKCACIEVYTIQCSECSSGKSDPKKPYLLFSDVMSRIELLIRSPIQPSNQ